MQNPRLIVLGLLKINLHYGWEMEEFVKKSNMRAWAKIGMSTIYKTLNKMVDQGLVEKNSVHNASGPNRFYYSLLDKGEAMFSALVTEAISSKASVYSDRIPALVFAPVLGRAMVSSLDDLISSYSSISTELSNWKREANSEIATVIVEYYEAVYQAENDAARKVKALIAKRGTSGF